MDLETYALLNKKIKGATAPTDDQVQNSVDKYLSEHPVKPGATQEEAQQILQNTTDIEKIKIQGLYVSDGVLYVGDSEESDGN